ncbi:type IX secretion system motor protein PorL/GldL [Mucilaginibacter sp. KACC 22063]|uniref:type IX secretion system motor protein PorL/GldL n=1 Tax=Mucilaginibacter sp. KACC 22063 TaxID=3025666 RepID=UPI002366F442|nr:gliding motility protein GldL [Mucilaginibacter sp. KACC 22063]WDF56235.1 gliding motility protein GldL [Mucilaginibacter sp. KACC 22063]
MALTKKKPYGISNVVSWGATIVIIGLMMKILHKPGGEYWITAGLTTEAILFFILGFQRENEEVDWTKAYPELDPAYTGGPVVRSQPQQVSTGHTAALDKMLADANISPDLIGKLGDGLRTFGDKVANISTVADAGAATNEFASKLKSAGASYDNLSAAFAKATANINEMASTNVDSKAYHEQVNNLAKNLSALNAVYELELQDSSAHLKAMNKFYSSLSSTMQNFNESLDDSKQFKEEVGRLSKNLASLNAIYGNMLSAMNQPRA